MRLLICVVALAFSAGASAAVFSGLKVCTVESSCLIQRYSECQSEFISCKNTTKSTEEAQLCLNIYYQCAARVPRSCTICTWY